MFGCTNLGKKLENGFQQVKLEILPRVELQATFLSKECSDILTQIATFISDEPVISFSLNGFPNSYFSISLGKRNHVMIICQSSSDFLKQMLHLFQKSIAVGKGIKLIVNGFSDFFPSNFHFIDFDTLSSVGSTQDFILKYSPIGEAPFDWNALENMKWTVLNLKTTQKAFACLEVFTLFIALEKIVNSHGPISVYNFLNSEPVFQYPNQPTSKYIPPHLRRAAEAKPSALPNPEIQVLKSRFFSDEETLISVIPSNHKELPNLLSKFKSDAECIFIDFEWNSFQDGERIDVIQFGKKGEVLIVTKIDPDYPKFISKFFEECLFVGKKMSSFLKRMKSLFDCSFRFIDVEESYKFSLEKKGNFDKLVESFVGPPVQNFKDKAIGRSSWNLDLNLSQIFYAAYDVVALSRIYPKMKEMNSLPHEKNIADPNFFTKKALPLKISFNCSRGIYHCNLVFFENETTKLTILNKFNQEAEKEIGFVLSSDFIFIFCRVESSSTVTALSSSNGIIVLYDCLEPFLNFFTQNFKNLLSKHLVLEHGKPDISKQFENAGSKQFENRNLREIEKQIESLPGAQFRFTKKKPSWSQSIGKFTTVREALNFAYRAIGFRLLSSILPSDLISAGNIDSESSSN